jgi:threonyl-tRNA synthetase
VDGELRDLSAKIDKDAAVAVVTPKKRDGTVSPDALFLIRHSAAHVMAEAIQDVVGKDVQLAYGPPTDTGFFYDMHVPGRPITAGDFDRINARMGEIIKEDRKFTRYELSVDDEFGRNPSGDPNASIFFKLGTDLPKNKYKVENAIRAIEAEADKHPEKANTVTTSPNPLGLPVASLALRYVPGTKLSFYVTGPLERLPNGQLKYWEDLCRGPHVPSTGRIGAAKVMSLASSYWHGDENSDRLTRVYGTAFGSQAELDAYLVQLEEAKKRDHRVIGKQMRLFHIDEEVGQGLILWTPNGGIIREELQAFIGAELKKQGYFQVFTPHIGRLDLYKTSGHFPYYKDSQYAPVIEREALNRLTAEGASCADMSNRLEAVSAHLAKQLNERTRKQTITPDRVMPDEKLVEGFLLKPMNCPHHVKIFKSAPHSYRDMPVRLAEFGTVYRWEQSGELSGMLRVRSFTQDDAHLFCTEDQLAAELQGCLSLVKIIFGTLGIKEYRVRVGLRDADSAKYTGTKENWDKAEAACIAAAETLGVAFTREPGEAAFYGPKIDFVVRDVIGREWQLGTVQVDYNLPIRFDLSYIGPDNKEHRPVMIHRAPFGSMERFCGFLIEHFAGSFPAWLAPEQVRVMPISEKTAGYAQRVLAALKGAAVRATLDDSGDRIQAKIKAAADEKVPYMAVVGPRDEEQTAVSVRARGVEKDLGAMPLEKFVEAVAAEVKERRAVPSVRP